MKNAYIIYDMEKKALSKIKIFILAAVLLMGISPFIAIRDSFATTYPVNPKLAYQAKPITTLNQTTTPVKPQRAHAPEPSTIILFLSGLGGMIIRFAKRRFQEAKRILDLMLAALGLTLSLPILLLSAIAIKLTSQGPVVYKQKRVGLNGGIFEIYKLRTMCQDAEKNTGAVWAKKNDSRVTPIGRILRKTHIDEIPQIFNIIKGQMSVVGPRPERPEIVRDLKTLIHDYEARLNVKPGLTGLAQVLHKYDESIEDVKQKIKYDLMYIKEMRWGTEMQILARTFVVSLTGKGAN